MARGFDVTLGSGTTDKITSTLTSHATSRSYHTLLYRNGDGSGGFGRIFDKLTVSFQIETAFYDSSDGKIKFQQEFGNGPNRWYGGTTISAGQWYGWGFSLNSTVDTNNPLIYLNGVSETVTQDVTNETGAGPGSTTDPYVIGNRGSDDARPFDGLLAEFAIWDAILTPAEFAALGVGVSPILIRPESLVEYLPMLRDNVGPIGGAPTIQGTAVQPHPRVFYPNAPYLFRDTGAAVRRWLLARPA